MARTGQSRGWRRYRAAVLCALGMATLGACGHEAARNNPMDPALTPVVAGVTAAMDADSGAAVLRWEAYEGEQPFSHYSILRKRAGYDDTTTVAHLEDRLQTSFADTSVRPGQEYLYRVVVVNRAGYEADPGSWVSAGSYAVRGAELLAAEPDTTAGLVRLRWRQYRGPGFERYEVWRREFGRTAAVAVSVEVGDTTAADTTAVPYTQYGYWLETVIQSQPYASATQLEMALSLPQVELETPAFSSATATASLRWTEYEGPRFASYAIWRRASGISDTGELPVAVIQDQGGITYTDSLMDGNILYTYRVAVNTTWGEQVSSSSSTRTGGVYLLDRSEVLPSPATQREIAALALADDDRDGLYVGALLRSTTTARDMQAGVYMRLPGSAHYVTCLTQTPDAGSPLRLALVGGVLCAAYMTDGGAVVLAGIDPGDGRSLWALEVDTDGQMPVALYEDLSGRAVLIDALGGLYPCSTQGVPEPRVGNLALALRGEAVQDLVYVPGLGPAQHPLLVALQPTRPEHRVRGVVQSGVVFGGSSYFYDDGVGTDNGQVTSPLALAYDPSQQRLVVLEGHGRLQVLGTDQDAPRHYVTKWGGFGSGSGEFFVASPNAVALAVDSEGVVYVADGAGQRGRVQVFRP